MANKFIDELIELSVPAPDDWLVIEDTSAGETKKIGPGTSITADVQTSATDTTAGRLMAVNAFGLGGFNSGDFNAGSAGLMTRLGRLNTDVPAGSNSWHGMHISRVQDAQSAQMVIADQSSSSGTRVGFRQRGADGTWAPWVLAWHTGNTIVDGSGFIKEA